jgi:hypothetical protein
VWIGIGAGAEDAVDRWGCPAACAARRSVRLVARPVEADRVGGIGLSQVGQFAGRDRFKVRWNLCLRNEDARCR